MTKRLPAVLEAVGALLIILAAALVDVRLGIALAGCAALLAAYALERAE